MVRSVLCVAFGVSALAANEYAFVGSGGCDGDMVDCVDDKTSEQTLQQIEIQPDGKLVAVDFPYYTGGMPVWLAGSNAVGGLKCVFVALADKDEMLSLVDEVPGIPSPFPSLYPAAPTGGAAPVHMTVTVDGKFLLVANYHGPDDATTSDGAGVGSIAIKSSGVGCGLELVDFVPHAGSGPDKSRQGGAHVHSVYASRNGKFAYACDLGQDLIFTYSVAEDGKLSEVSRVSTAPGSGPRHLAEHPSLSFVYSVQEMEQTVAVYLVDADGRLSLRQMLSLVPEDEAREGSKAAEIVMHPNGTALYVSNRGRLNTVTVFAVRADGLLEQSQQIKAPRFPRGMALAQGGSLLLVASQEDTTVESFNVDSDGRLTSTGYVLKEGIPNHPAAFQVFPAGASLVQV